MPALPDIAELVSMTYDLPNGINGNTIEIVNEFDWRPPKTIDPIDEETGGCILFKPFHVEPILAAEKTETRRSWARWRVKVGGIYWAATAMFGKGRFARIRVVKAWCEHLGDITPEGAKREGGYTVDEFLHRFMEIAKDPVTPDYIRQSRKAYSEGKYTFLNKPVKVVRFEVVKRV